MEAGEPPVRCITGPTPSAVGRRVRQETHHGEQRREERCTARRERAMLSLLSLLQPVSARRRRLTRAAAVSARS